ncbi:MAG: type II/IV secretion system protein, partial [Planctomycetota bacterium]
MNLAEILLKRGLIDDQQLTQYQNTELDVFDWVAGHPGIDSDLAFRAAAEEYGVDFIEIQNAEIDLSLLENFPQKLIYRETLFPIERHNGSI